MATVELRRLESFWEINMDQTVEINKNNLDTQEVFTLKVKCTLVQALRLCTGHMARKGSRGIAPLIHDHITRRG